MKEMNGVTVLNVYQQSLLNLTNNNADHKDWVIVKMWNDSLKKQEEIAALKQAILDKEKVNGKLNHALDCFHSRENLKIMGESNVGSYLKGLLDSDQIMTVH